MSHALLLRLFLSPSFFTVHVALQYLSLYSDNIGITYYLTRRLKEKDIHELRDVWGFVCHLLVTKPSKSRALECFVVDVAQRSTHIAMFTLWFMQASLKDLSNSPHGSQSFLMCQRVLHKCHEIIFGDLPTTLPAPYSSLSLPLHSRLTRRKVKQNFEPTVVGIGMVLAGSPGMPTLTQIMGEVAIEQGRQEGSGEEVRSLESSQDDIAYSASRNLSLASLHDEDADDGPQPLQNDPEALTDQQDVGHSSSADVLRHNKVRAAQTAPALPLHLRGIRQSRLSEDPLGQLDSEQIMSPYQSTPIVSSARPSPRPTQTNSADVLLQSYDAFSQAYLLRSQYCRSEIQFILSLESICNRLLVIPRPARVSALRAELTALNHKLPAEVCMPMWCSSSDSPSKSQELQTEPHHRIVRVPPGESVVLNSAERAPYLLYIEILHNDLDFDPNKRSNKEILKKIVVKEDERKGASRELIPFTTGSNRVHKPADSLEVDDDVGLPSSNPHTPLISIGVAAQSPSGLDEDDDEMDLVEQLYGTDKSLRSTPVDFSESIVLPAVPKNRELDMAAWSSYNSDGSTNGILSDRAASEKPPNGHAISLDEYSERMRTAAIMLAQLNANLARDSSPGPSHAPNTPSVESSSMSWLPGSGWLTSTSDSKSTPSNGPSEHTSAPGGMRLQQAEADAIKDRIMKEMLALEDERMGRMREHRVNNASRMRVDGLGADLKTLEDESIIRRELSKADPSAVVFSESWTAKKSRIRQNSPYGHLANWDCVSVIVKTGGDLRQEQLAVQLIQQFQHIWEEENCQCWVRHFNILITGGSSGLVETITDAVSIHSIKKAEYGRRLAEGRLGTVTLMDHFKATYGDPSSAKFVRAQRNFAKSLAGYSIVTYLLQIKDRHNGNILLDREGHLIHIDFGFILTNTPGNIGFEAAPFKLPAEYIEVLGGVDGAPFQEFRRLFREGFEAARKHCDGIVTLVELMQKDSTLPCFALFGEQTSVQLRERFQPRLTHSLVGELTDRLIDSSVGSHWTRLYDSYQYYSQSIF